MRILGVGAPSQPALMRDSKPTATSPIDGSDTHDRAPAYLLPPDTAEGRAEWVRDTFLRANDVLAQAHPEGLAAKSERMRESLFRFFRGAATLFYLDLARHAPPSPDAPQVRMVGDVHVDNFGTYRSASGRVVYDLNDFDETADSGPFEWEVTRAVTSWLLAARDAGKPPEKQERVARAFVDGFTEQLQRFATEGGAETFTVTAQNADGPVQALLLHQEAIDESGWASKLIETAADGSHRFVASEALEPRPQLRAPLDDASPLLVEARIEDVAARQDSGTASLGLPRWYLLEHLSGDAHKIIEVKQQIRSALDGVPHVTVRHDAHRAAQVADAGATLSADPYPQLDAFQISPATVGALPTGEAQASFLVRERAALKATVKEDDLGAKEMAQVAVIQGRLLAAEMARQPGKAREIAAWLDAHPSFPQDVVATSKGAADRTEADYRSFKRR